MTAANVYLNGAQRAASETMLRAADLGMARPAAYVAARLENRTAIASEAQRLGAIAELLNRTLQDYTLLTFDPLPSGRPSGFDHVSGIVRIPAPWTTASHRKWGIRRGEQAIMLRYMHLWAARPTIPPIYIYAPELRRWCVALGDYPTIDQAGPIVQRGIFTADAIAKIEHAIRADEARRKRAPRTGSARP